MKDLKEMSDQELLKLREQTNSDLGDDGEGGAVGEFNDQDVIEALSELSKLEEAAPSVKKGAPKSPPKGYPTSKGQYADPTNFKYPLDTEAHVRAALAYFSKAKNRSGYSPQEQKFMWKRIIAATKKYDIELSDDVKKHAEKLGDSSDSSDSSEGRGEVKEELNEKEIVDIIHRELKAQMGDTGQAPNTMEKAGYPPVKVRVPPDIEAIQQTLENFKQMHAQHSLNNTDMAGKVAALTKQVTDLNSGFQKMQASFGGGDESSTSSSSTSDDSSSSPDQEAVEDSSSSDDSSSEGEQNADGGGQQESLTEKAAKEGKAAGEGKSTKEVREASSTATSGVEDGESPESDSSDEEEAKTKEAKTKPKHKKKVKEQMKQAKAHGLTATSDQTSGTGTQPSGFGAEDQEQEQRSFGDVMNQATRLRRRGIGAT